MAELDVKPDLWFFPCHFKGDPVMPGCLGLDALWQMLGFFLGWLGAPGSGRALGVGEVKFSGMVLPTVKKLEYIVDLKRVIRRKFDARHRRWRAQGRRRDHLYRQGPAGRLVPGETRQRRPVPDRIPLGNVQRGRKDGAMRRVVVTGMGIVSSIGNNAQEVLTSLREARSGIVSADDYAKLGFRCQVHGAPTLEWEGMLDRKVRALHGRRRSLELRRHAAGDPDSGLKETEISHERTGLIMGSGGPSTRAIVQAADTTREKGPKKVGPFEVPKAMSHDAIRPRWRRRSTSRGSIIRSPPPARLPRIASAMPSN